VSAIDVLTGIGWLDQATLKRWRQAQFASLEAGIPTNLARISVMSTKPSHALTMRDRKSHSAVADRADRTAEVRSQGRDPLIEEHARGHEHQRALPARAIAAQATRVFPAPVGSATIPRFPKVSNAPSACS
jgi:hypothetical protein